MADIKFNNISPDNIMSNGQQVDRIYSKGTLVWEHSTTPVFEEVTIGTQTWTAVNLDTDDGGGGIYAYDDDENNVPIYGRLYTWDAAMRVAASIDGWHLPSIAEWTTLSDYLGGDAVAGGKLKEIGTTHWNSPNTGATNESKFTALPGGFGYFNQSYKYTDIGVAGIWWSSTDFGDFAYRPTLLYSYNILFMYNRTKEYGYSVRLIKDE